MTKNFKPTGKASIIVTTIMVNRIYEKSMNRQIFLGYFVIEKKTQYKNYKKNTIIIGLFILNHWIFSINISNRTIGRLTNQSFNQLVTTSSMRMKNRMNKKKIFVSFILLFLFFAKCMNACPILYALIQLLSLLFQHLLLLLFKGWSLQFDCQLFCCCWSSSSMMMMMMMRIIDLTI